MAATMKVERVSAWLAILLGVTVLGNTSAQAAEPAANYPSRNVRMVIPFVPGGSSDIIGRILAQKLSEAWGQQVIVDNRGGGGTVIGTEIVAKAAPDGHTILLSTPSFTVNATGVRPLPYNPAKDFAPITLFAFAPMMIVATPSFPPNTIKELVSYAKANVGKVNFGSAGNGSINQMGLELIKLQGAPMTHVPYKGAAPAMTDVAGGQINLLLTAAGAALPLVKAGKLKAIAVTSLQRIPLAPDIPAVAETFPGYEVVNWYGFQAPGATPPAIVAKINTDMMRLLKDADVLDRIARESSLPGGTTPEQFRTFLQNEIVKWTRVIKETGATVDQ
jgi:tripartite-type tricarboxylate transporter receptor subunit TctC